MNEKLVVVLDLGRLRAYRLKQGREFSEPGLELIEDWQTEVRRHLSEEVTDEAGRFRKGTAHTEGPSALSDGEQHNLDLERRRRALKTLAARVDTLLDREQPAEVYLAADKRINQPLLDELQGRNRAKIQKNLTCDLSKASPREVLNHFCE